MAHGLPVVEFPGAALVLLGFALGGFIDGILLHQVLQWHHLLSAVDEGTLPLATQIAADGFFHLVMYVLLVLACLLLWRWRRGLSAANGRSVLVFALAGFVLWQLVDIVVFHWVARIHRVRMDTLSPLSWDLAWLAVFGGIPGLAALALVRGGGEGDGRAPGAALSLAALAVLVGGLATRSPQQASEDVLVLALPGAKAVDVLAALGDAGARVTWVDADGGVWAVRELRSDSTWQLLARGVIAIGAAPAGLGCGSFARPKLPGSV